MALAADAHLHDRGPGIELQPTTPAAATASPTPSPTATSTAPATAAGTAAAADASVDMYENPLRHSVVGTRQVPGSAAQSEPRARVSSAARYSLTKVDAHTTTAAAAAALDATARHRRWCITAVGILSCIVLAGGITLWASLDMSSHPAGFQMPATFVVTYESHNRFSERWHTSGRLHKSPGADGRARVEAELTSYNPVSGLRSVTTVVGGRAYLQTFNDSVSTVTPIAAQCYPASLVPPLGDLGHLVDSAVVTPTSYASEATTGACKSLERWVVLWGLQEFVFCRDGDVLMVSSYNFHAVGHLDRSPPDSLGLVPPANLTTGQPLTCPKLPDVTASASAPSFSDPHDHRRRLASPARPCYFVHGTGVSQDQPPNSSFAEYWGDIETRLASFCTSTTFLRRDTVNNGWDSPALRNYFCGVLAGGSGGTVGAVNIFTHGSGGLVVASALSLGTCSLGSQTGWYSAHAPFEGAGAARSGICALKTQLASNSFLRWVDACSTGVAAEANNYIPPEESYATVAGVASTRIAGALCGKSAEGNFVATMGQELVPVSDSAHADVTSNNDGWMSAGSCEAGASSASFESAFSRTEAFFSLDTNYLDGTCRWADPNLDINQVRSPCRWYRNMAYKQPTIANPL